MIDQEKTVRQWLSDFDDPQTLDDLRVIRDEAECQLEWLDDDFDIEACEHDIECCDFCLENYDDGELAEVQNETIL